jgi:hypothetical protein
LDGNPCTGIGKTKVDGIWFCTFAPEVATTICRLADGACDVEELCTGTSTTCPADERKPAGTSVLQYEYC